MSNTLKYSPFKYYFGIVAPLLFCSIICLSFRETNSLGAYYFEHFSFRLSNYIELNDIILYNLPSALWVFSMTLFSLNIKLLKINLINTPVLFITLLEFLQLFSITDGTFDLLDIVIPVAFWLFALALLRINRQAISNIKTPIYHFILYPILFISVILADTI